MEAAIVTNGLTRTFDGLRAVDRLDLEVPQGIIFGFLGPNGAGKTTTIRLLLGLLEPTAGSAKVLGFDLSQADRIREHVGVVLEQPGLYTRLSAYDNLDFFAAAYRVPATQRKARIRDLLTHLGLWERRNDFVDTYSKGMKQKLAFARALLHRPSLIFMDEPTAGLDVPSAAALREDIVNLVRESGTTVFLTTHNLAEAESMCDLIAVINKGKLVTVDTPDRLRTGARKPQVRIVGRGFSPQAVDALRRLPQVISVTQGKGALHVTIRRGDKVSPVVKALTEQGAEIEEVVHTTASLEEAFLALLDETDGQDGVESRGRNQHRP